MKNKIGVVVLVSAALGAVPIACGDYSADGPAAGTGGGTGAATCGNSTLESGETCDPPESCPATCDDSNTCTVDEPTGSAATCTAACSHTPITACAAGDGCCAPGCDSSTDSDCLESCDGVTTCSGGDGCCPSTCTRANDSDCPGTLPCDILETAGLPCVTAHSTVRIIVSSYTGPLYQLCSGNFVAGPASCQGTTQDIGAVDGIADIAAHDAFCGDTLCTITKIYDQSGLGNHLEPAPSGGAKGSPDEPAEASELPVMINGHDAYGILIQPDIGYRAGCTGCTVKEGIGTAKNDEPQTIYMVTSQEDLIDGCCFNYGNAETTSNDDGNGTMEALYFGGGVIWGTGFGGKPGPWIMADLENGLYAGWENGQDQNISTNVPLLHDFVSGVLVGDTADKNNGKGRFALYGGDATAGALQTMYDGIRPEKTGYVPMLKQGSLILGIGGDNSNWAGGRFYEGAMSNGVASKETVDAIQASIVAAGYGR